MSKVSLCRSIISPLCSANCGERTTRVAPRCFRLATIPSRAYSSALQYGHHLPRKKLRTSAPFTSKRSDSTSSARVLRKGKVRNRVADPDNAVHDARRLQVLGGTVHDCSFVRWNAGLGPVTDLVELFLESHHESPFADDTSRNRASRRGPIEFKPSPPPFVSRTPTTQETEVVPHDHNH